MAVMDRYCRIHGLRRLLVVEPFSMSDVVWDNTNFTAIVIGEPVAN